MSSPTRSPEGTSRALLHLPREWALASSTTQAPVLPAGVRNLELEMQFVERGEEVDLVRVRLGVEDAEANRWEATGALDADFLVPFTVAIPPRVWSEDSAPPSWRRALERRRLLEGVQGLWDERIHQALDFGEAVVPIFLKYQGPVLDLALVESGPVEGPGRDDLLVRLDRLHDEEGEPIPPCLYTLPLYQLLELPAPDGRGAPGDEPMIWARSA